MFKLPIFREIVLIMSFGIILSGIVSAQTTQFTYQGRLTDSTAVQPTNGTYEMQFKAFDAATNGNQFPVAVTLPTVQVVNGIFTVTLDFNAATFRGADVFLEIGVRPSGSANPFTTLAPRQKVTSAPYAIQSLNAINASTASDSQNLGGIAANLYVQTNDSRLTDARAPTAGSANYIQNTTGFQPLSNFNISGGGTANTLTASSTVNGGVVNSTTQYNIGGSRVLSVGGTNNTFAGLNAATVNTGTNDSFFGSHAGQMNTTGFRNSFFGESAGGKNTTGSDNSFYGIVSGALNTTGNFNSFFGDSAGFKNNADNNSFYGYNSGGGNTTGASNSFFGYSAGSANTTGTKNAFFGESSGAANTIGDNNSFFGYQSGQSNSVGGANNSVGSFSNSFFGSITGKNNTSGNSNSFFGAAAGTANTTGKSNSFFGTGAGLSNTDGNSNSFYGYNAGVSLTTGTGNTFVGNLAGQSYVGLAGMGNNTLLGSNTKIQCGQFGCNSPIVHSTAVGADAVVQFPNTIVLGTTADSVITMGDLRVGEGGTGQTLYADNIFVSPGGGGSTNPLCLTSNPGKIAFCSSSLRYKTNIAPYAKGFDVINRLRPITFDWKENGTHDLGFGAEDVEKVDPLLVSYNRQGIVEGVKYDRISAALVNAVKEQQAQIEQQQKQLQQQQLLIDGLQKLVCAQNLQAEVCREQK